jgi:hypothetical protein
MVIFFATKKHFTLLPKTDNVHYIHKTSVCTSQTTHLISITDINLLMSEISAVFYVRNSQNT